MQNNTMNYKIIVAMDINRGIGINNKLPWNIPSDMKKFKELTKGNGKNAIIMGKNTWLSLPNKPLMGRDNIILSTTLCSSKTLDLSNNNIFIFDNIDNLNLFCREKYEEIWVIGGSQIYKEFLKNNLINEIYITQINNNYKCDTFFPELDLNKWNLIKNIKYKSDDYILYNKLYTKI